MCTSAVTVRPNDLVYQISGLVHYKVSFHGLFTYTVMVNGTRKMNNKAPRRHHPAVQDTSHFSLERVELKTGM